MNTENISTFIELSKYKNFTKTAQAMFIAQSTVTNRIAELEKEVGKKLFERERKGVCLTEEGRQFLDYAIRISDLHKAAIDAVNVGNKYSDKLNIGSTNTIYDCHLKTKINKFIKDYPDVSLKITISHSSTLAQMVNDGVLDFSFTYIEQRKNGIECIPFRNDKMVLVTDRKNDRYKNGIKLSELSEVNYLYCNFTFQGIGEYIKELFPKHYRFSLEIDKSANIIPYLYERDCYSFLPKNLVSDEIKKGSLIEIPLCDFSVPKIKSFILVNKSSRSLSDEMRKIFLMTLSTD